MKENNKKDALFPPVSDGVARFNSLRPGTEALFNVLFILLALMSVIPVVFTVIVSFSSQASIGRVGYSFLPAEWSTEAYQYVWSLRDRFGFPTVLRAMLNSLAITIIGTVLGLGLISSMGYVLSRRTFRLRKAYSIFIFIPMTFIILIIIFI